MAGNVATYDGFKRLADVGADSVRVGIGGGSVCTTRIVSGHGVPTAQSVSDIAMANEYECSIIADGGIRNSGDMVKAFALGADAVMLGSMLAGTDEAPGELFESNGSLVKHFRGMASSNAQIDFSGKASVAEGVSTTIPYKGSVNTIVDQIRGGLGSGCSYSGVQSLEDLYSVSEAIHVSALSVGESKPHALVV
jgi:IMP dehydrogenase